MKVYHPVQSYLYCLFNHREKLSRHSLQLEEAQNFIPSKSEGQEGYPSVSTIMKIATEGRKFGTGLI